VIKQICSWLPPFCKQNLLLFIQPRWQLRRTYFFILGFILICLYSTTGHFHTCVGYFAKNVAYFPFNSWLSFQRLCRLLWGYMNNVTQSLQQRAAVKMCGGVTKLLPASCHCWTAAVYPTSCHAGPGTLKMRDMKMWETRKYGTPRVAYVCPLPSRNAWVDKKEHQISPPTVFLWTINTR